MNNGACRCFFLNHVWCIRQIKLREGVKKLFMESVVFLTPSFQGKSSKNTVFLQSVQVSKISQNKLLTYFENLYGQPDSKKTIFLRLPLCCCGEKWKHQNYVYEFCREQIWAKNVSNFTIHVTNHKVQLHRLDWFLFPLSE